MFSSFREAWHERKWTECFTPNLEKLVKCSWRCEGEGQLFTSSSLHSKAPALSWAAPVSSLHHLSLSNTICITLSLSATRHCAQGKGLCPFCSLQQLKQWRYNMAGTREMFVEGTKSWLLAHHMPTSGLQASEHSMSKSLENTRVLDGRGDPSGPQRRAAMRRVRHQRLQSRQSRRPLLCKRMKKPVCGVRGCYWVRRGVLCSISSQHHWVYIYIY